MSPKNRPTKKNDLLLQKEKLLEELKCCEKQIEDAKQNQTNNNFKYDDSSDSDSDLSLFIYKRTSLPSLVRKKTALFTRCNATAELTGLEVLESTVNVLSEDPDLDGERPVIGEGVWQEVIAECKVDLIPFTISFYVHQPSRLYGQRSYRCLRVAASKEANERELSNSILSKMVTPSDAFEVIKSYAAAHRSRRTTLARLAETYGNDLFMTPLPEGGYQLMCANVLELSWTLESKPSTVAYFRHRMKLTLEYMDESYLKIITQANKEMSHPSVDTDERTLLLSKIISTCLKAQGEDPQASESQTSRVQKRPNETQDLEHMSKKRKANEVMGPPTALPKKSKVRDKEDAEGRLSNKTKNANNEVNKDNIKAKKNVPDKEPNDENRVGKVNAASKVQDRNKDTSKSTNMDQTKNTNANKVKKAPKKDVQTNKENTKNTSNAKPGSDKNKNPTKDSNKEIGRKTNDNNSNNQSVAKLKDASKVPDLKDKSSKNTNNTRETTKTDKSNTVLGKDNVEKPKQSKDKEKIEENKTLGKGKNTALNRNENKKDKENAVSTKNMIKENNKKHSQANNKQNITISKEEMFPQTKRFNLKPNIVLSKNDRLIKNNIQVSRSDNTGNIIDSRIKTIKERFSNNSNTNKGKINLQKTKIPRKTSAEKIKLNLFRMSPRTSVTKMTSSTTSVQRALGDVKRTSITNIARLVKKPPGKTKLL